MDQNSGFEVDSFAMTRFVRELISSPINLALLGLCAFLLYKILRNRRREFPTPKQVLPPMKKRDFTLEQLKEYNGRGQDGRILIAVNGKVFDVTRGGRFYGPGTDLQFTTDDLLSQARVYFHRARCYLLSTVSQVKSSSILLRRG